MTSQTHIPVGTDLRGRPLSPRELEVLRLTATGEKQAAIAHALGISDQTVKNLCHTAYQKLDVQSNIAAFVALGWLRVPPDGMRAVS